MAIKILLCVMRARISTLAAALAVWSASASAAPTACLAPETTRAATDALRRLVELRQVVADSYGQARVHERDAGLLRNELLSLKATGPELACMGFDVRFKGRMQLEKDTTLAALAIPFLLLDETMLPTWLRPGKTRPDHFERRIGRWMKVVESFKNPAVAGSYNILTKRIRYRSSILEQGWPMRMRWLGSQGGMIFSSLATFESWKCGSPNPEGAFQVVLHEYGHDIDFALAGLFKRGVYSSRAKAPDGGWARLHEAEFTSPYGDSSAGEDFAESFAGYLLDPLMKCYAPEKYEWFKKFVAVNQEVYGADRPYADFDCNRPEVAVVMKARESAVQNIAQQCPTAR